MIISFIATYFHAILIAAAAMALFGVLTFVACRLRLRRSVRRGLVAAPAASAGAGEEGVSVVICCHDEGRALEEHLPKIMEQRGVRMEVIVADDCSTDSTPDVLKRMEARYPNLRHTFVPATARYVSHEKLAITLGVKAARYPWIVLTRPACAPLTDLWLKSLSARFAEGTNIVLGYANYADDGSRAARRGIYERLRYSLAWYSATRGRAIGADGCNMAFRREAFLATDGYASSLDRTFGTDDLLARSLSRGGDAALCLRPAGAVREFREDVRFSRRRLMMRRAASLVYDARRTSLAMISLRMADVGFYVGTLGFAAAIATLIVVKQYPAAAGVGAAALALATADMLTLRATMRRLGERPLALSLLWYELICPPAEAWRKMQARMRKRDYVRKI